MKLTDGRILIGGGNEGWATFLGKMVDPGRANSVDSGEGWDVFSPTTGKFDLDWQNQTWNRVGVTAEMWPSPIMKLGMGTKGPTASLADGKLMIGAGAFPINATYSHTQTSYVTKPNGHFTYKFDPASMAVTEHLPTPAGRPARAAATFTALSDGRILSVGGWDLGVAYDCNPQSEGVYYATSSQADLFDPATNTWTPVGSMARDRIEHAAVLLPTGQVMIVGGYKINPDGTWELAETVELFDPDAKTFTTKERLDYGILDPKIAMQADGGQFISGLLMDLRPAGTLALEGSSTASGSRRLPADLRPTGDTHAWIEKLHRLKREQPERFDANSIGGMLYTIPGSAMLQVAGNQSKVTLIRPNGSPVLDSEKTTLGGILQVNLKENPSAIPTNDDYLRLRLNKIKAADSVDHSYKVHFTSSRIAIWQDKNKTQPVVSDTTTFPVGSTTTLYVEGLQTSADMTGEMVSMQLFRGPEMIQEDKVKIVVAQMVFAIIGDGATGDALAYNDCLSKENTDDARKDKNMFIIRKDNGCFSVRFGYTQTFAKMALSADGGNVVYDGHSNFGIGFAFSKNMTGIQDFMNVGEEWAGINWPYLVGTQGQTQFKVSYSEYGDNLDTPELYDPYERLRSIDGTHFIRNNLPEFFNRTQTSGVQLHLTPGQTQVQDMHYGVVGDIVLVARNGAFDMPVKRWKKLFLNACESGRYYYRTFNYGTLFYTLKDAKKAETTNIFIQTILSGLDNDGIYTALKSIELDAQHDYQIFP